MPKRIGHTLFHVEQSPGVPPILQPMDTFVPARHFVPRGTRSIFPALERQMFHVKPTTNSKSASEFCYDTETLRREWNQDNAAEQDLM
jgi:hypothetical protein